MIMSLFVDFCAIEESENDPSMAANNNTEIAKAAIAVCQSIIDCLSNQVQISQTFEEKKSAR